MTLYKEYVKMPESAKSDVAGKEIKFTISFNRDTINWATSQPKKIGYQVSAIPVERTNREDGYVIESSGAFTGFNDCLLEIDRQSKKRLEKAIEILKSRKDMYLSQFIKVEEIV